MTGSILVLTEQTLTPDDAAHVVALHAGEDLRYEVLVPADTRRNLLADVLDHLSLFELRKALIAARGHEEQQTPAQAQDSLETSLSHLRSAGVEATGQLVHGDPVTALAQEIGATQAREVLVVTRPHAVEDTFHTDWASKARERLGVPVLHIYAGTTWLG